MKRNGDSGGERKRCSELELEVAKLMEAETQAREALERKYVEGWEDAWRICAPEAYDRGYADGIDDTTRRDFQLG
ncbi:MAG TPA: hypothetical protein VE544_05035 [Nitrososphaeraceae archaeon]|jgi:hypothetical protein|nr:hypothetical protein [Nitrososphaeraceae archaeon]